jgi:hypothetical protein
MASAVGGAGEGVGAPAHPHMNKAIAAKNNMTRIFVILTPLSYHAHPTIKRSSPMHTDGFAVFDTRRVEPWVPVIMFARVALRADED